MQMIMEVYKSASEFWDILQSYDSLVVSINEMATYTESHLVTVWWGPNTD